MHASVDHVSGRMKTQRARWRQFGCMVLVSAHLGVANADALEREGCPQEHAVYVEELSGTTVRFEPDEAGAATVDSFSMRLPSGETLSGLIVWNNGISRPNASLAMEDCEGGNWENDCLVWSGVLYQLHDDGFIRHYGSRVAASQLLFPDVSRVLWFQAMQHGWLTPSIDTFLFLRCSQEADL